MDNGTIGLIVMAVLVGGVYLLAWRQRHRH